MQALLAEDAADTEGVNDRAQLARAGATLRDRLTASAMRAGVTIVDPASTWLDATVVLEPDCIIEPFSQLTGSTTVGAGAVIGPYTKLTDCSVGEGATVLASIGIGAQIGPAATIGPYSYLRPGTVIGRHAKVGTYVETKNVTIGDDSKVPHLSYVGDAVIGQRSNVGAATIFVNYDGVAKHRSVVGDDVRIGSDSMLVAPVHIGDGAYTAAGSVITEDVPPGAIGIGRARQRNIAEWVDRKRPGTRSAESARLARAAAAGPAPAAGTSADSTSDDSTIIQSTQGTDPDQQRPQGEQ